MSRLPGRPLAALTVVAALALAGCTTQAPDPAPAITEGAPTAAASDSASPTAASATPSAAALVPGGTAQENLPFFTQIVAGVWAGPDQSTGRAYIDALSAGGFDRGAMQVTADQSTIGNAAESIAFSVRIGGECLVGQVGPSIGQPVTAVMPGLAAGGCLIGQTVGID